MEVSRIVIGSLSVLAGGSLGTALIYFYTKENMGEGGRDNFLPLNANDEDGKLVFKYFKENKSITNKELKKIESEQSLKNGCSTKYRETFSGLFHMTNGMQLSEMKKACLLPIKKKLKNNSQTLITEENQINIQKLKNHSDSDGYKLTYILEGIKNMSNLDEQKKTFFNGCQAMADHGYQGEDSNTYKLVKGLCLKNPIARNTTLQKNYKM